MLARGVKVKTASQTVQPPSLAEVFAVIENPLAVNGESVIESPFA